MSAATTTRGPKHAAKDEQDRRHWFGIPLRRRKSAGQFPDGEAPAPRGEHPYPVTLSIAEANEILRTAPFKREFAGASGTGQPEPRLPDSTDMLAAILEDAKPEELKVLERTRDGLKNLDEPEPLLFFRYALRDGTLGTYWDLAGGPAYLGLARSGERKLAEVRLGYAPDGRPYILAADADTVNTLARVLVQAWDQLIYATPSAPPAEDTEAVTAEAAESAPVPDVIEHVGEDTADEAPEGSAA